LRIDGEYFVVCLTKFLFHYGMQVSQKIGINPELSKKGDHNMIKQIKGSVATQRIILLLMSVVMILAVVFPFDVSAQYHVQENYIDSSATGYSLTFHMYLNSQTPAALNSFIDMLNAAPNIQVIQNRGFAAVVIPVTPGQPVTHMSIIPCIGNIYGVTGARGQAFWGWFDDEALSKGSGGANPTTRLDPTTGLRRPALAARCMLVETIQSIATAATDEAIEAIFGEGNKNLDLFSVWSLWGDVNDDGVVNQNDLNLLSDHIAFGHIPNLAPVLNINAADVFADGVVNQTDLNLLADYISFGNFWEVILGVRPQR